MLKKFDFVTIKTTSTPIKTHKALLKDEEAEDVDVHLYRSMIGSLMYLTTSRPDIMFVVCACARFQVTPKVSYLHAMKRIFRYLKGQPKLGLWYPRDSPFDLEAFFDSDYVEASLDRKSTTGVEYVTAANCYGQVLWIQNQMLDYGFNFMNTKIYIDNERTICIVKNPVFHSKTKKMEIRHHFIIDSYEKRLIQVIKIHTDHNVAEHLTKAFDVSSQEWMERHVGDEAVHKELGDIMERAATTASSLEAEQDSANLDFCDKHNMVAFLKKPEGSEGFHQIVDFLNSTHIKYALTRNPTIYVSLIYQFWQTAFASTSENREMEITATIDGRVKTVTEASIRRHLKLEDSDGISTLPNTEIFEQLALMGISKGYNGVDIPLFPTMPVQGLISQGKGSTVPVESHHTPTSVPSTSQPPTSPPSIQTTHVAEEAATMPHDSPLLRVYSLGRDEGSMTLHELTVLCTTLPKKVESLESDLKQTKLTYGLAYTKLIMKVKKLENIIKSSKARRRMGLQTQGRHEHDLEPDFEFTAPKEVYTNEPDISTTNVPISIVGAEVSAASPEVKTAAKSLVYIRRSAAERKDKGKAIMKEAEPVQKKTKLQLEQERLGYEEALRLQEQLDEE
ncbi:hypothetical protein Tco_1343145 [Tanacetum coccineum]